MELKVLKGRKVPMVMQGMMVLLVHQVLMALPERLDQKVRMVTKVALVMPAKTALLVPKVKTVMQVPLVPPVM